MHLGQECQRSSMSSQRTTPRSGLCTCPIIDNSGLKSLQVVSAGLLHWEVGILGGPSEAVQGCLLQL